MDFDEAVRRRRMCRSFTSDPLPAGLLDHLLELAGRAPSAGGTSGCAFLSLTTPAALDRFWAAATEAEWLERSGLPGLLRAPAVVVPMCNSAAYVERYARPDKEAFEWTVPYWFVDAGFATMTLLLGAEDRGLGALFFRLHRPPAVLRSEFGVPDEWEPIGAVAIGYPSPDAGARRRHPAVRAALHRESW